MDLNLNRLDSLLFLVGCLTLYSACSKNSASRFKVLITLGIFVPNKGLRVHIAKCLIAYNYIRMKSID